MLSVVDRQDHPVRVLSTADRDLIDIDVISVQDVVEALSRLIDPVEAMLVHINGDHLHTEAGYKPLQYIVQHVYDHLHTGREWYKKLLRVIDPVAMVMCF